MHNNRFPKKIPGRKPDSEAGCIFENFAPKQDNSLKILAAGTRNHGVSLPPPPRALNRQISAKIWDSTALELTNDSSVFSMSQINDDTEIGYDYTIRFIVCDSIQTYSFMSERFQSHTMIYREFKRIGRTNRIV